jgi:hypothetical protein
VTEVVGAIVHVGPGVQWHKGRHGGGWHKGNDVELVCEDVVISGISDEMEEGSFDIEDVIDVATVFEVSWGIAVARVCVTRAQKQPRAGYSIFGS